MFHLQATYYTPLNFPKIELHYVDRYFPSLDEIYAFEAGLQDVLDGGANGNILEWVITYLSHGKSTRLSLNGLTSWPMGVTVSAAS